jgi:hypothetical protein
LAKEISVRHSIVGLIAFTACLSMALPVSATAPSATPTATALVVPVGTPLKFHCQWTQRFGRGTPWTGDMTIKDNAEGLINGTYRSTSIKPDPFYGKIITVTGSISGKSVRLSFGIVPNVTVRGELIKGGIQGTTAYNGGTLEFAAALAPKQQ